MTASSSRRRESEWEILHWRPEMIVHGYLLLLGTLFFLWPVSAGIPGMKLRITWIVCATVFCLLSAWALERSLRSAKPVTVKMPQSVCLGLIALAVLLLLYGATIPILTFSDEATIALPSLTLLKHIAHFTTWIGLFVIVNIVWSLLPIFLDVLTRRWAIICFIGLALFALMTAQFLPESRFLVRYPPLVHLMQAFSTASTFGALSYLRTPNMFWTILLGMALWEWRTWPPAARIAAFLAILLGPLGWTYRTVLFQACGEITLGMIAVLLLAGIFLERKHEKTLGAFLGAIFALWFLYRPTSLAAIVASLIALALFRRRSAAFTTASVALPVVAAWLLLSPIYTASYGFFSPGESQLQDLAAEGFFRPLFIMLQSLPANFHIVALVILIGTSALTLLLGERNSRILLLTAWLIALPPSIGQQMTSGDAFHGVARYNILLLLPLGLAVGNLFVPSRLRLVGPIIGLACIAALFVITPFDFIDYTQRLRASSIDIYRTPPEGYLALPVQNAVDKYLREPHLVVLAPQSTFLDLFVATGELTVPERSAIMERSPRWTPDSPDRPILIQAPVGTSYRPNLTERQEDNLRVAREWGLLQPNHRIEKLGIEEIVIVP